MVVVRRVVSERTFSVMAQGGDVLEITMPSRHYEDIKVPTPLNKFLEGSTWLYPIIRFFGHALQREHLLYCYCSLHLYSGYSYIADHDACRHLSMLITGYRYDIEFIRCTTHEDDRNWILYESYCDLVSPCISINMHAYNQLLPNITCMPCRLKLMCQFTPYTSSVF